MITDSKRSKTLNGPPSPSRGAGEVSQCCLNITFLSCVSQDDATAVQAVRSHMKAKIDTKTNPLAADLTSASSSGLSKEEEAGREGLRGGSKSLVGLRQSARLGVLNGMVIMSY